MHRILTIAPIRAERRAAKLAKAKAKAQAQQQQQSHSQSDDGDAEMKDTADSTTTATAADDEPESPLAALILTPTRELALQITRHLNAVAKFTNIKVMIVSLLCNAMLSQ